MKAKVLITGLMLLLLSSLSGCGGSGGSSGSTNSNETGVLIQSINITPAGEDSSNIDVNSNDDTAPILKSDVIMKIWAERRNDSGLSEPFPTSIEECTITYLKALEDPSSPIIPTLTIYPNCTLLPSTADAPTECTVTLIDVQRKNDYWNAINQGVNLPAEYPTHYVARYSCKYRSNFDEYGTFVQQYDFWLADF